MGEPGWGKVATVSEKSKLVAFSHETTEQAYLNLFSFMNYTWLSSPSYTPRGKKIFF